MKRRLTAYPKKNKNNKAQQTGAEENYEISESNSSSIEGDVYYDVESEAPKLNSVDDPVCFKNLLKEIAITSQSLFNAFNKAYNKSANAFAEKYCLDYSDANYTGRSAGDMSGTQRSAGTNTSMSNTPTKQSLPQSSKKMSMNKAKYVYMEPVSLSVPIKLHVKSESKEKIVHAEILVEANGQPMCFNPKTKKLEPISKFPDMDACDEDEPIRTATISACGYDPSYKYNNTGAATDCSCAVDCTGQCSPEMVPFDIASKPKGVSALSDMKNFEYPSKINKQYGPPSIGRKDLENRENKGNVKFFESESSQVEFKLDTNKSEEMPDRENETAIKYIEEQTINRNDDDDDDGKENQIEVETTSGLHPTATDSDGEGKKNEKPSHRSNGPTINEAKQQSNLHNDPDNNSKDPKDMTKKLSNLSNITLINIESVERTAAPEPFAGKEMPLIIYSSLENLKDASRYQDNRDGALEVATNTADQGNQALELLDSSEQTKQEDSSDASLETITASDGHLTLRSIKSKVELSEMEKTDTNKAKEPRLGNKLDKSTQTDIQQDSGHQKRTSLRNNILSVLRCFVDANYTDKDDEYSKEDKAQIESDLFVILIPTRDVSAYTETDINTDITYLLSHMSKPNGLKGISPVEEPKVALRNTLDNLRYVLDPRCTKKPPHQFRKRDQEKLLEILSNLLLPPSKLAEIGHSKEEMINEFRELLHSYDDVQDDEDA